MDERPANFTDRFIGKTLPKTNMLYLFFFSLRKEDTSKRIPPTKYGTNRGLFCWKVGSNISLVWNFEYEEKCFNSGV